MMEQHQYKKSLDKPFTLVHDWVYLNREAFDMGVWCQRTMNECGTYYCMGGRILAECGYSDRNIEVLRELVIISPTIVRILKRSGYPEFTEENARRLFYGTTTREARWLLTSLRKHEESIEFQTGKQYPSFRHRIPEVY